MKLFIVFSACLVLAYGQGGGWKSGAQALQPVSSVLNQRQCPPSNNKWECLCRSMKYNLSTCRDQVIEQLEYNPNSKLCADHNGNKYIAIGDCHREAAAENVEDPTGKAMQFALDLFKAADPQNPNKNYVVSPLSPQVLLAQLTEGCSPAARDELIKALRVNSREVSSLVRNLQESANKDNAQNKLDIASVIFQSKALKVEPKFTASRKDNDIRMEPVDFADTSSAVNSINRWVQDKTRGNIQEIVSEANLSPDTSMLLLNAIYFKGTWRYKFNDTQKGSFETTPNKKMPVHMMSQTNRLRFGEINFGQYYDPENGLRWVELPYEGDQLSMILLLPKTRFQLDQTLERVNGAHLQDIFKTIKRDYNPNKIHLKLPKFTVRDSVSLVEPLKKLGVKAIFEDENALSELSKTPVKVGDVKQESFLSVDEKGTTATAVTKITIIPLSLNAYEDIHFECNEPFMVMIVDKTSQIPLFMAKIREPTKASRSG